MMTILTSKVLIMNQNSIPVQTHLLKPVRRPTGLPLLVIHTIHTDRTSV